MTNAATHKEIKLKKKVSEIRNNFQEDKKIATGAKRN